MTSSLDRYDYHQRVKRRKQKLNVPLDMPLKQFERTLTQIKRLSGEPELVWPVRAGRKMPAPVPKVTRKDHNDSIK